MPSKIVFWRDNFECHQKLSPHETILGAIKNRCAQKIFLCLCETSFVSHKKKSCARKKNVRAQEKNTVEDAGTQQLTKNNAFRKTLVYLHIRENARCAIFAFCVDFLRNRTRVGPTIKKTKKWPNDRLEKNRGSITE